LPDRAVFLDRDGTLIEDPGYLSDPAAVRLIPGAVEGLRALHAAGYRLILVSNQSGIGRGYFTPEQAEAVHQRLVDELARAGVVLDDARYCPHAPDAGCACRKPQPGLLLAAAEELGLDLEASFMIGNSPVDVGAGRNAGCRTILLGAESSDTVAPDLEAPDWPTVVSLVTASR
jgi:D-glycero-D-manno-heptose 1,7-bisphosphate phosphatase